MLSRCRVFTGPCHRLSIWVKLELDGDVADKLFRQKIIPDIFLKALNCSSFRLELLSLLKCRLYQHLLRKNLGEIATTKLFRFHSCLSFAQIIARCRVPTRQDALRFVHHLYHFGQSIFLIFALLEDVLLDLIVLVYGHGDVVFSIGGNDCVLIPGIISTLLRYLALNCRDCALDDHTLITHHIQSPLSVFESLLCHLLSRH